MIGEEHRALGLGFRFLPTACCLLCAPSLTVGFLASAYCLLPTAYCFYGSIARRTTFVIDTRSMRPLLKKITIWPLSIMMRRTLTIG